MTAIAQPPRSASNSSGWSTRIVSVRPYLPFGVILVVVGYTIHAGASAMHYEWQWGRVPSLLVRWQDGRLEAGPLIVGLLETVRLSLVIAALTLPLGVCVAMMRLSSSWSARFLSRTYVDIARNTPLIVQISMVYFVLSPVLGIGRFWTGVLTLTLFEASFVSEIVRAGILAVPDGQWEASFSLGLTPFRTYRQVILPQAIRVVMPPLTGAGISLVKNTSIVSVIALFELTTAGRDAISTTFMSFEIWLTVAAIYLALTISLSCAAHALERRLARAC